MATGPSALARTVNSTPELVFVYGTLKRGHGNHHWLAEAPFHGEGTEGGLVLHDLGPFPMAIPGADAPYGWALGLADGSGAGDRPRQGRQDAPGE
ncbi:gamma-glutamylcyclotransferase [Synechococcus sp. CS-1332]|uniref:gamma-glutamylcyclotransferase family protein n=1 Tax=Synechococcus sp. CS-1332 TaxID=2847972 RepID=UPI00223A9562|nr:gamma-glutamylcyclotransferase family protein [Synechococcus sp. CS-1332]MCT0207543.1 gamma-glutamylcyclotransferase [Synechococcus sp. CS-1332]